MSNVNARLVKVETYRKCKSTFDSYRWDDLKLNERRQFLVKIFTFSCAISQGVLPEDLGGGVRRASGNPYPTSDQDMWLKSIPYFRSKRLKNHTLWRNTYQHSLYKGVPPRGGAQTSPYFRPKWSKSIPYFRPKRLKNHTLWRPLLLIKLSLSRDRTERILPSVFVVRPRAIFSQYGPRSQ